MAAISRTDSFHWIKETSRDSKGIILEDHISEVASFLTVQEAATWHASHPRLFAAHPISKIGKALSCFLSKGDDSIAFLRRLAPKVPFAQILKRLKEKQLSSVDEAMHIIILTILDFAEASKDDLIRLGCPSHKDMVQAIGRSKGLDAALQFSLCSLKSNSIGAFVHLCVEQERIEYLPILRTELHKIQQIRVRNFLNDVADSSIGYAALNVVRDSDGRESPLPLLRYLENKEHVQSHLEFINLFDFPKRNHDGVESDVDQSNSCGNLLCIFYLLMTALALNEMYYTFVDIRRSGERI